MNFDFPSNGFLMFSKLLNLSNYTQILYFQKKHQNNVREVVEVEVQNMKNHQFELYIVTFPEGVRKRYYLKLKRTFEVPFRIYIYIYTYTFTDSKIIVFFYEKHRFDLGFYRAETYVAKMSMV